jgi:hypothetical protein
MGRDGRIQSSYVVIVGEGEYVPTFYDFSSIQCAKAFVKGRTLGKWKQVEDHQFTKGKKYVRIEPRLGVGNKAAFVQIEENGTFESHPYVYFENAKSFVEGVITGRRIAGINYKFDPVTNSYEFDDGQKITIMEQEMK